MKFAIAQLNPTVGDLTHNAQQVVEAARQADQAGVEVMVTTELVLCGYPPRDLLLRPGFIRAMKRQLDQLATELPPHLRVLVGFAAVNPQAEQAGEKPLFNSAALLQGGEVQQVFHKQLLPTYDVFDEDRYFAPGPGASIFSLAGVGRVGITICEDLWNDEKFWGERRYPQNPIADLAAAGVDLVINLSASPYALHKPGLRAAMLAHSAQRYNCALLYANQVGGNDDLIFDGASMAFNRQGKLMGQLPAFHPGLLVIDYDAMEGDLQPTEVTALPTDGQESLWSALCLGVRDYARKCGFTRAVIGLSGGIDSALVATIAAAALGPEQVLGVLMPSPYSSDHSISDAQALCQNLGIDHRILPIEPLMLAYDQTLASLFAGTQSGITEENLQSRIRGNLLMAIANKFGYLLLSTGNKSEMAVGYCTLYGDMNGGLAAIADVPKTRVYSLCDWINQHRGVPPAYWGQLARRELTGPLIPQAILDKPPSAELKPDQVDQDSLPPYPILDDILERLVNHHQSLAEITAAGHDAGVVEQVMGLVTRAEFKRRQAPPVLKVTDRAFGLGWRMPIAYRWSKDDF
ncbi:MAG: NAD+ synthase [Nodosilinea sp.]